MAEDYSLLGGKRAGGMAKAVGILSLLMLIAAVAIGIYISTQVHKIAKTTPGPVFKDWKTQCDTFNDGPSSATVTRPQGTKYLIKNATVWMGPGKTMLGYDVLLGYYGKIEQVAANIPATTVPVIQADGAWVTPGLFDMHSHAGVYSFPVDAQATQDGNEMTNPTFPAVRAIDAFDPEDPAIAWIRASGVTTSQILPGSGNVMGGQAVAVKFNGKTVGEMAIPNAPVALKFACGENPKNTYGSRRQTPMSRMGIGYEMRNALGKARTLLQQKQEFCAKEQDGFLPTDLALENLVSLLRKQAVLNIHCYKVVDFEMAIRVAKEYNLQIAAFHHAIEAWKIPEILVSNNIAVALFSDIRGYKFEAYKDSVWGPRSLNEKGVKVIFKTDHPVIFGWELLFQAQKAAHWGLRSDEAINAVTTLPARTAGFSSFGAIAVGQDSDVVIWDRHPLRLGAQPQKVFINGNLAYESTAALKTDQLTYTSPYNTWQMTSTPTDTCLTASSNNNNLASYALTNAKIMTAFSVSPTVPSGGNLIVTNGNVSCVGFVADCPVPAGYPVFNLHGGTITPGFINVGMPLGNVEVDQESTWQDGAISGGAEISSLGGAQLQTTHTQDAWADGILTSVSRPASAKVIMGSSSSFFMGPSVNFLEDPETGFSYILAEHASVDVQIGNAAKGHFASVSEQLNFLKTTLATPTGIWNQVFSGSVPLVIWANSADYILSVFRTLEAVGAPKGTIKVIIGGAAEAHLVANKIKEWGASVIFRRCGPDGYETRRCNNDLALRTLKAAGISVGLAQTIDGDMSKIRGLRWNAGLLMDSGFSQDEALATVTSNLATMFNLPDGTGVIARDTPANWVAFNGNPLDTTSIIEILGVNSKIICKPQQA